jgi:hypothetical protein
MSLLSDSVLVLIKQVFPYYKIFPEYFVSFRGTKLFFDFFLPELFEAQGCQHDRFVGFFHNDDRGFQKSRMRDRLKKEWAAQNNIAIIEVRDSDMPMEPIEFMEFIASTSDVK